METKGNFEGKGHSLHLGRFKVDISNTSSIGGQYSTGVHYLEELWNLDPWRFSKFSQIKPWLISSGVVDGLASSGKLVQMAFRIISLIL